ncbi:P-loop containing nucleoside triphosphate hydrolase protein [Meredithblackwellia eburnea MCA 4105]
MVQLVFWSAINDHEPLSVARVRTPHPLQAVLPAITVSLCITITLLAHWYRAKWRPLPTEDDRIKLSRDLSSEQRRTSGQMGTEGTQGAVPYVRALLITLWLLTCASLLSVTLGKVVGGDSGHWGLVFDLGVIFSTVYLAALPFLGSLSQGISEIEETQRAGLSAALLVELGIVNLLPLTYSHRDEKSLVFGFEMTQVGLGATIVVLLSIVPPLWKPKVLGAKPHPSQVATPLSRHLFAFLEPGMVSWYLHPEEKPFGERVPPLPDLLSSVWVLSNFMWDTQNPSSDPKERQVRGGVGAFAWRYRSEVLKILIYALVWLVGVFASPLSLNLLLNFVQNPASTQFSPYVFVFGIFAAPVVTSIAYQQALYRLSQLGARLRVVLASAVFQKVLRTKESGESIDEDEEQEILDYDSRDSSHPDGEESQEEATEDLVGTDIDVITSSLESSLPLLGIIPKLVVSLIGLYLLLGWSAFIALATILAFAPFSVRVSKRYGGVQEEIMKATDRRLTIVGELVSSIRIIKTFAWESSSKERITAARHAELEGIKKRAKVFAGMMLLSTGIPTAVTLLTFGAFVFGQKEPLTASTAFTSMSLFGLLREAVISSTYLLSAFMRAKVSLARITSFICSTEELDEEPRTISSSDEISIVSAKFKWSRRQTNGSESFVLSIDKLDFPKGKVTIVAGDVGSGKSALLYSLLGEMHKVEGEVKYPKSVKTSYASQSPWLQDDTIRNNILFGAPWDEERYQRVLFQCSLEQDLKIMPEGDKTVVGEKGLSVSGGQKQRIALARAVYSKSDVVLLDDILSAVDSNTVSHIVEHCLNGDLLAGRTVILVTHFVKLCARELSECELVVYLSSGRIHKTDHPSNLHRKDRTPSVTPTSPRSPHNEIVDFEGDGSTDFQNKKKDEDNEVEISWAVYQRYFSAVGGWMFWMGYILVNLVAHTLMLAQGWWVGRWVNEPSRALFYYICYAIIQIMGAVSLTVMYLYLIFGAIQASRKLHHRLTNSIFGAPIRFFDTTAQGNIINRFSKDTEVVDTEIVESTQPVFDYSVQVLFVAIMVSAILPLFLIPALLIGALFAFLGRLYIRNALAARKHVAGARSPMFSTLADSTSGVVLIRAFQRESSFSTRFMNQTDTFNKMKLHEYGLQRWLEERSDFVAALVSFFVGILSLRGNLSSGTTGFLVATGLEFTSRILYVVRAINLQELSINSADRIVKYSNIEQEPAKTEKAEPPANWPHDGVIEFDHFSAKYGSSTEPVLHDLTFIIRAGEKVGVVGPSGCGKSSLALSLLRFILTDSGSISIDGRPIQDINLEALRSRVTLIPQDPTLFSGTLRSNLDPTGEADDADLWNALKRSQFIREQRETGDAGNEVLNLDSSVASGGSNFSQGQRQLLSLARAMVRSSKVLILDEATASLDNETDELVQRVIRQEFEGATQLTIAHRLDSVMDFDRVMVLRQGRLVEFDEPKILLDRKDSVLRNMVEATGNWDRLYEMASKKDTSA